jgi:hypothetical protein
MTDSEMSAVQTEGPAPEVPPAVPARRWRGWALAALGLLVALGTSYGAYLLAGYSWNQVVDYQSPYLTMSTSAYTGERPPLELPIPDATPRRVVMVVVDGLTDAASRTMASVNELRERGSDVALTVTQPSLSYPSWTTILTGAPPHVSGVTTNWYDSRVEVQTLFDVAAGSGRSVAVVGPTDLDLLYGVSEVTSATVLTDWPEHGAEEGVYLSGDFIDSALSLARQGNPDFLFVLLPDVDEAGHSFGGASPEYAAVVAKVDADLDRLVTELDDGETVFVVLPDHGGLPKGGHGGWEDPVIHTFAAFAGPGVAKGTGSAGLEDIASTVSVLAGLQAPQMGKGIAIEKVLADPNGRAKDADFLRAVGFTLAYAPEIAGPTVLKDVDTISTPDEIRAIAASAEATRLAEDRRERLPMALGLALAALVVLVVIGLISWRALVAALAGALDYVIVYNVLFFVLHGYRWSLSAFNKEELVQAFMNGRMIEAVIAGLIGCVTAGLVYVALQREPRGARSGGASRWVALGVATALAILAVLAFQIAWFLWQWGAEVSWIMPDLKWGFKYDLDLIQATAIAGVALLGPLVTYLIGRFHPKLR